jgi:hypothetical protein
VILSYFSGSWFFYDELVFRICHCEGDSEVPLIAPCYCAGSLRYVHQACLQQWIKSSDIRSCELCKFQFIMRSKIKPFSEVNLCSVYLCKESRRVRWVEHIECMEWTAVCLCPLQGSTREELTQEKVVLYAVWMSYSGIDEFYMTVCVQYLYIQA